MKKVSDGFVSFHMFAGYTQDIIARLCPQDNVTRLPGYHVTVLPCYHITMLRGYLLTCCFPGYNRLWVDLDLPML